MLSTAYSPWFILLCLAVGAGYTALLYSAQGPWSRAVNYTLAGLRFVVVSFLCFLLLSPFIKTTTTRTEAPTIVLAVDNSQSISLFTPKPALSQLTVGLPQLAATLREKGFRVETRTLTKPNTAPDSLRFTASRTDLSQLLSDSREANAERNLAGVVLVSDGLVNRGQEPQFSEFNFPIFSVALGDTVAKRDLRLTDLVYNRVAFSGNKFPLEAEIGYEGYAGGAATVEVREGGRVLQSRRVALPAGRRRVKTTFQLTAPTPGKRRYEVRVLPQTGEFTVLNNARTAFVEVVKGKLRVLLAGAAPHPDLKALRAAILANNNFDLTLVVAGVGAPLPAGASFDVAVLHQLPARGGLGQELLARVRAAKVPVLYVLGAQSDYAAYNQLITGLNVQPRGAQTDEVTPLPNPGFARLPLDEESRRRLAQYPPVPVPFGDLRLGGGAEAALWQQVGRLPTQKPLLVFGSAAGSGPRAATLLAENTWQWRLAEAIAHDNHPEVYDRLIGRTLQLLTQNANKKRLDVYPTQDAFGTQDDVTLGTETYNAVFERIYDQKIILTLTDSAKKARTVTFANAPDGSPLHLGPLPAGLYRYQARATLGGQAQQTSGELLVQNQPLEAQESKADHRLLAQLSRRSGGRLYYPAHLDKLAQDIEKANFKPQLSSEEDLKDLVNLKWLFFALLALLTAEWATRKYQGGV
ncbi:VWA domain-containing protein [Hymenobacter sp. H14-R3]|uniref:VWA domain-containing protein n=1 Tax=Hymenobacter sp. H14-R3 TaxID=3046308 RepID=UPI0024BA0CA7|nr:VWA domain-containing protein [Hymenobacter sp. H14-R3]MDJ0366912.1 VWA domain-containing protein [Hymenobacter sp. H14-R3]